MLLLFPGPRSIRRGPAAAGQNSEDDTIAPLDADDPLLIPHLSRYDHRACNGKGNLFKNWDFHLGDFSGGSADGIGEAELLLL